MVDGAAKITITQYAEHRKGLGLSGQSHQAVRKALGAGRIKAGEDGMLDPAQCDADWEANTSIGKRASGAAGGRGRQVAAGRVPAPPTKPPRTRAAPPAPPTKPPRTRAAPPAPPADDPGGIDPGTGLPNFNTSRAKREHFQAESARLEFLKVDGTLVDAEEVRREAARAGRILKDAMLALPDRLSGELAAMTDPHAIFLRLREEISDALQGIAREIAADDSVASGGTGGSDV